MDKPDEPGLGDSEPDHPAADSPEPGSDLPPEQILELIASCVTYVQGAVGIAPDLRAETLPLVDHYLSVARQQLEQRPELGTLIGRVVGAYFGEVVRRAIGGFWDLPSPNVLDWRLCARPVFLWFNRSGIAYDALYQGAPHEGPQAQLRVLAEDRDLLQARLDSLPPVSEEEFYLLSTRFEAIEVAVDALLGRQLEAGYEDMEFTLQDYRAEMMR
jgi:hypothetical protein